VAEAWVASDRKHLYASSSGLGQSFSFDMLMCNYNCKEFKDTISQSLKDSQGTDGSTTWVFSSMSPLLKWLHSTYIVNTLIFQTTMSSDMPLDTVSPTLSKRVVFRSLHSVENTSNRAVPSPSATLSKVFNVRELLP